MKIDRGLYSLDVIDSTLFFNITGAMDEDILKSIFIDVNQLIQTHFTDPAVSWASVMDLSQWGLYTPETEADLIKFQYWANKHGQKAEVCITSGSPLKVTARQKILSGHALDMEHVFVDTMDEAMDWLNAHNYLTTKK